jgi:hypothetical protein
MVSVLARVEDVGQDGEGGVGDGDVDGGLAAGLVPQDARVECGGVGVAAFGGLGVGGGELA